MDIKESNMNIENFFKNGLNNSYFINRLGYIKICFDAFENKDDNKDNYLINNYLRFGSKYEELDFIPKIHKLINELVSAHNYKWSFIINENIELVNKIAEGDFFKRYTQEVRTFEFLEFVQTTFINLKDFCDYKLNWI